MADAKDETAGGWMKRRYDIPFDLGDRVVIDGDDSIQAVVTALAWRATMADVEVSYVHSGDVKHCLAAAMALVGEFLNG